MIDIEENLEDLTSPSPSNKLSNQDIFFGSPIPKIDRLKLMSPSTFEEFILEWASFLKTKYVQVRRSGGAGDMGRDIVATVNHEMNEWDNYQCKHYDHALYPSDIWTEIGKLCYYTFIGAYTYPRKYYFVAPQSVGNTLSILIGNPINLKKDLFEEWDDKCKNKITSKSSIIMTPELRSYIESLDFSVFDYVLPLEIIEQHSFTNYHAARFGGGLNKRRPYSVKPKDEIESKEVKYVEQLFAAYEDHCKQTIPNIETLKQKQDLFNHFNRQRESFYCAESLEEFSRDALPHYCSAFKDLKKEIYDGVIDISSSTYINGYERLKATLQEARRLNITSNPLISVMEVNDRGGICHQLVNDNQIIWVNK